MKIQKTRVSLYIPIKTLTMGQNWVRPTQAAAKGLLLRYTGQSYKRISGSPTHLGGYDLVATSLVSAQGLPINYVADEKSTFFNGSEASVTMTAAQECVWGISISLAETQVGLQRAYGNFATEARLPDFAPQSVAIDGWAATRNAWQNFFPHISLILCFLHGILKIGTCTKNLKEQWAQIRAMLCEAYKANDAKDFIAHIEQFKLKAQALIKPFNRQSIIDAINKIWAKKDQYAQYYEFTDAYRTSNQVDRPMNRLDR